MIVIVKKQPNVYQPEQLIEIRTNTNPFTFVTTEGQYPANEVFTYEQLSNYTGVQP
jgi:hypothetical protein